MASDPKQIAKATEEIQRMTTATYPIVVGNDVVERPFKELRPDGQLQMLSDLVDWRGITNSDRATMLLTHIDVGKISDAKRNQLIDEAAAGLFSPSKENKALFAEWNVDYQAGKLRDSGNDYETFLKDATDRAISNMDGRDRGIER